MKKIISIFLVILMIIGIVVMPTKSYASFSIESADLYSKGVYSDYLHFGNVGIVFNYVVYSKDGAEYPAYCLNKDLDGVTSSCTYSVGTEELLTNVKVWRAIINGYPYKTAEELGCNTNEEAFIATKQAVYCMLYDRNAEEYNAYDEREQRVLNALTRIVTNANNSSEVKQSAVLDIKEVTTNWQQDDIDKEYVSKTFTATANAKVNTYKVLLDNINIEGARIVNEQNLETHEFKYGENFKILLPITSLQKDGNFNLKVEGKVATKPVLYGYSTDRNLQDYAITGNIYEDGNGIKTVYYPENGTKIVIVKKDDEENKLEGVKFNIFNEKKEVIYADLTTNKDGEITVKNIEPGIYYIKEIATLNNYEINNELIEANVAYNEELIVTVLNAKSKIEIEKPKIEKKDIHVEAKLPKTGM